MVIVRENTECLVSPHINPYRHYAGSTCAGSHQYIKEETLTLGANGKEARATRLITERASRRIGQMAFEVALTRGANVRGNPTFARSSAEP
jgi:homoisocitrate dehydrogenase